MDFFGPQFNAKLALITHNLLPPLASIQPRASLSACRDLLDAKTDPEYKSSLTQHELQLLRSQRELKKQQQQQALLDAQTQQQQQSESSQLVNVFQSQFVALSSLANETVDAAAASTSTTMSKTHRTRIRKRKWLEMQQQHMTRQSNLNEDDDASEPAFVVISRGLVAPTSVLPLGVPHIRCSFVSAASDDVVVVASSDIASATLPNATSIELKQQQKSTSPMVVDAKSTIATSDEKQTRIINPPSELHSHSTDVDASSPFALLRQLFNERARIHIVVRRSHSVRSLVAAYLTAFDRHCNLVLMDCDEHYKIRCRRRRHNSQSVHRFVDRTTPINNNNNSDALTQSTNHHPAESEFEFVLRERHVRQLLLRGDNVVTVQRYCAMRDVRALLLSSLNS